MRVAAAVCSRAASARRLSLGAPPNTTGSSVYGEERTGQKVAGPVGVSPPPWTGWGPALTMTPPADGRSRMMVSHRAARRCLVKTEAGSGAGTRARLENSTERDVTTSLRRRGAGGSGGETEPLRGVLSITVSGEKGRTKRSMRRC